jgi:multidrug resistance protein MdtO
MLTQFDAFLRQELRPAPERHQMMFRYILVAALVLVTSMTLQIPSVALSIIMMFSATRENARMTLMAGRMIIIGATCAVMLSLLLLAVTLDWPAGRITGAMMLVFAGMFFLRASRFGSVGYLVAVLSVVLQSEADTIADPETLVRSCLWLWGAIVYPVTMAMIVARLTPAASAPRQFRSALCHNWQKLDIALYSLAEGETLTTDSLSFIPGVRVSRYQQFALMTEPGIAVYREAYEQIRNTQHLVEAAVRSCAEDMKGRVPDEDVQRALYLAAAICAQLAVDDVIKAWPESPNTSELTENTRLPESVTLILTSLDALLSRHPQPSKSACRPVKPHTLMSDDWHENPVYRRFALKAMLATFICYLFYNAVAWPGIRTCMTTAIILALPSLGSSVHKAHLRIGGCLVGALLSILCIVFILPYLDTITGLLVVSLPVVALAGWLAAGSTRIDYAGHQVVYTWALAMYGDYGMTLDLTTTRDRIVGILIGAGVVFAVFSTLWPERSEFALSTKLRSLLNLICDAARLHHEDTDFHARAGQCIRTERQLSAGLASDIHQFSLEHHGDTDSTREKLWPNHSHTLLKHLILIHSLCRSELITPDIKSSVLLFLNAVAEDMEMAGMLLDESMHIALPDTHRVRLMQLNTVVAEQELSAPVRRLITLCCSLTDLLCIPISGDVRDLEPMKTT